MNVFPRASLAGIVRPALLLPFAAVALAAFWGGCLGDAEGTLVVGTTTTTQDAGLLDVLIPAFERDTGHPAKAVVGGTGEVIEKARRGDVHVLFTHSPERERALVEEGVALERRPVMSNAFFVAGPAADPAGVANATTAADAFLRIAANASAFASRGDESGTHEKEIEVWRSAGLDPARLDRAWYAETGAGQAQTLLFADERGAYLLVDEGTLAQLHARERARSIVALFAGGDALRNQYAVTRLARSPDGAALAFAEWITGERGQATIATLRLAGASLFTPSAGEAGA